MTIYHPCPVQNIQMPRNIGLRQPDLFNNLMNRTLLATQTGKNAQARWISQQSKVIRNLLKYLLSLIHNVF